MPRSQIKKNKKEVWRQLTHSDITALGYHWTECELIMSRLQRCFNQWTIASVDKSSDGLPRAHSKLPSKRTKAVKPNTSSETTQIVKERKKERGESLAPSPRWQEECFLQTWAGAYANALCWPHNLPVDPLLVDVTQGHSCIPSLRKTSVWAGEG